MLDFNSMDNCCVDGGTLCSVVFLYRIYIGQHCCCEVQEGNYGQASTIKSPISSDASVSYMNLPIWKLRWFSGNSASFRSSPTIVQRRASFLWGINCYAFWCKWRDGYGGVLSFFPVWAHIGSFYPLLAGLDRSLAGITGTSLKNNWIHWRVISAVMKLSIPEAMRLLWSTKTLNGFAGWNCVECVIKYT